jgi:hypothetical protein
MYRRDEYLRQPLTTHSNPDTRQAFMSKRSCQFSAAGPESCLVCGNAPAPPQAGRVEFAANCLGDRPRAGQHG